MVKKILMNCSYDLEAVEKFLEKAAAEGLMFVKKDGMLYYFEKCEPKTLKFSVDVFEKASIFDTRPETLTEEYIEYCKVSGWVHCGTYGKIQIFYNEDLNAVPIRTDEERFECIRKNAILNEGVNWVLYLLMFVLFSVINTLNWGLARALIDELNMVLAGVSYLIFTIVDFSRYIIFYLRNKKNIKSDKSLFFYSVKSVKLHHLVRTVIFGGALVAILISLSDSKLVLALIGLVFVLLFVVYIVGRLRGKRENSSRENNIAMSIMLVIILIVIMFYVPIIIIIGGSYLDPNVEKVSYYDKLANAEVTTALYKDEIPFNYEDIGIELSDVKYTSTQKDQSSSVFGRMINWDETVYDGKMKELLYIRYDILETKYAKIIESHMDKNISDNYHDVTDGWSRAWKAKKVYYLYESGLENWVVEYDNVIVEVAVDNMNLSEPVISNIVEQLEKDYGKLSVFEEGIYYEAVDEKEISKKYASGTVFYRLFHYNRKMYLSTNELSTEKKSDLPMEAILGDEIAEVYGNERLYWSVDESELHEVTMTGKLHKVNGYDEAFRVAIYYENYIESMDRKFYGIIVFDNLNGITLNKGKELFQEKLHLGKSVKLEGGTLGQKPYNELDMKDEKVVTFLKALNEGEFVETEKNEYEVYQLKGGIQLIFYDEAGLTTELYVFEDGKVVMRRFEGTDFVIEVDPGACKDIIKKIS